MYTTNKNHKKKWGMLPETFSYVSGSDVNSGQISLAVERDTYSPQNLCHLSMDCDVKSL